MTEDTDGGATLAEVPRSAQLLAPLSTSMELCYQTFGDPEDEPLVLVMGLGGPMLWWHEDFCAQLATAGFFVVRFDNRDIGGSTRMRGRVTRSKMIAAFLGRPVSTPYTLDDMAGDTLGLMDHLGFASAHVVGVSMGGMIAQTLALRAPERVRSLTSISSSTGRRTVGWQHPRLLPMFLSNRGSDREAYVEGSVPMWRLIMSPGFPQDEQEVRARAGDTWDHGWSAGGMLRQMMAVLTQPDRTVELRSLRMPALVVHGLQDPMVHISGGRATASAVHGAELLTVDGMGHDNPRPLWPRFVEAIRRTADRAA
ncbi:alpha/beta fold hydrolase [Nocardioidaceae bacterium]|nr:alpha/beta fold hydrolase [Nocardioidaceae bacterium]